MRLGMWVGFGLSGAFLASRRGVVGIVPGVDLAGGLGVRAGGVGVGESHSYRAVAQLWSGVGWERVDVASLQS
jgi:hypothetical protein